MDLSHIEEMLTFEPEPSALSFFLVTLAISVVRYLLIAGVPYFLFYKLGWFKKYKIQMQTPAPTLVRREFVWGMVSCMIMALMLLPVYVVWQMGGTRIYAYPFEQGIWWFLISLVVLFLVHDLWFYLTHCLLHHKLFFSRFHKIHHQSTNPTPWASLSFHPVEEILSFGFFPLMALFFPISFAALTCFYILMFFGNVTGHSGYELGKSMLFSKWVGSSINHNLHHTKVNYNFGLYTMIWDHMFGTFYKDLDQEYEKLERQRNHKI